MSKKSMEEKMKEFDQKKPAVTPSSALMDTNKEDTENKMSSDLSKIVKKKKRIEDTHKRRTFLIRNDLLSRLDHLADKIENSGFKTEFINHIMENGLNELEKVLKD